MTKVCITCEESGVQAVKTRLILLCSLLSVLVLVVDLFIPLGVAGGVPYVAVVLVAMWLEDKKTVFLFAVVGTALTTLGFFFSPDGGLLWQVLFNRALALFAIWVAATLGMQRIAIEKARQQAANQVKILQGLLPICAYCKKIRDENGLWIEMESFVSSHSQAVFSHSYCPICVQQLYGDLENYDKSITSRQEG